MWIYRDVTERKEQEKKRQRFQYAFESSLSGLAMVDQEGTLTHVNDAFVEMWGFDDRSDVVGRKAVEMWKQPDKAAAVLEQVIDNGGWEGELEASRADGATFYARGAASHLEDGSGDHIGIVASFVDISERRRREQEIQELKDRLELAIDGANLGVWDRDMRTGEVQVNDNWATMLGYDPDEIDPRLEEWEERIHPADVDAVETAFEAHLAGETEFYESERRMRTADGDWNWVRDIGKVIERNEDGDPIRAVGIQIDVDERKKYERELERTRSDLRQIIDLVPDLIFVKARDGEYLLANETTAEFYGLSVEEVEGSKEHEIIPAVGDSEAFRKDDIGVIESGEPREIPEEELTTADGETRILQTTKIPYQTSESDSGAVLGYARDVTSLKEYEQALERQRDDLEVLNQVVRHDIRNDLQLVLAYAETLADHVEEDGRRYVTQVLEAARDAVDITETARDVTEILLQQETDRFPVRLRHVLEHEIEDARSSTDQAVVRVEGTLPDVEVLADDILESVFRNLLTNAITHNDKAVPEVTVSASSTGDLARIRVADNGPGIPDDREARIFQEGETGLESEGTGLGLYLVQTLVDRYGGDVWIEENDPDGSVFVVELLRAT
ncbi:MAG: PAS domain S-box protein [Halodesulfurarchaeum sp.]